MILKRLLFITICLLAFSEYSFAFNYYEAGKKAYKEEEYQKASGYFAKALQKNPGHVKSRYLFAQALIKTKKYKQAQQEYEKIIEISPFSLEARLASIGISKIEKFLLAKKGIKLSADVKTKKISTKKVKVRSSDNYIENALESGMVTRWNLKKMPLTMYIERPGALTGYKESYFSDVKRAMDAWVNGTGNIISYRLVDKPDEANIRVYFVREIFKQSGNARVTGIATPITRGNLLEYYEVKFIPQENMYSTAIHELGHALGIRGHSSKNTDIMYAAVNKAEGLSKRDINTFKLLYELEPHISNFDKGEVSVGATGKNEKLIGSKEDLLNKKLKERIEYVEKFPNNVLSWAQLGKAYYDLEKYEQAAISLEKALEIQPRYPYAMETLAFTYKQLGKTQEAGELWNGLVVNDPRNLIYSYNYAYHLMENEQPEEAKKILQNLIKVNPEAKNDENITNLMYYVEKPI